MRGARTSTIHSSRAAEEPSCGKHHTLNRQPQHKTMLPVCLIFPHLRLRVVGPVVLVVGKIVCLEGSRDMDGAYERPGAEHQKEHDALIACGSALSAKIFGKKLGAKEVCNTHHGSLLGTHHTNAAGMCIFQLSHLHTSLGPASSTSTEWPASLSRLASTHPALPAPTMT